MNNMSLDFNMKELEIVTLHPFYCSISDINYNEYKYYKDEYNKLTDNNKVWDILSHSKEDNQNYLDYWNNYKYYAFIAVIFQALAVEAYINYYGFKNLGETKFLDNYEKLNTIDKYSSIYEIVNKKKFPKSKFVYENLKKLIRLRNNLVHSKSSTVNMEDDDLQKFMDDLSRPFFGLFVEIDKVMNTYNELIKIMENQN